MPDGYSDFKGAVFGFGVLQDGEFYCCHIGGYFEKRIKSIRSTVQKWTENHFEREERMKIVGRWLRGDSNPKPTD